MSDSFLLTLLSRRLHAGENFILRVLVLLLRLLVVTKPQNPVDPNLRWPSTRDKALGTYAFISGG